MADQAVAPRAFRGAGQASRPRIRPQGVVAVGSSGDRPLVQSLRRHLGPIPSLDLSGRTSLLELAALARTSDLFVSNDTGPLHLAAATGAAVVESHLHRSPAHRPLWPPSRHRAELRHLSARAQRGRPGSRPFCECQAEGSRWPSNGRSRTSRSEDVPPRSRAPGSMRGEPPRRPFPRS